MRDAGLHRVNSLPGDSTGLHVSISEELVDKERVEIASVTGSSFLCFNWLEMPRLGFCWSSPSVG
jgi:hypothetical protein